MSRRAAHGASKRVSGAPPFARRVGRSRSLHSAVSPGATPSFTARGFRCRKIAERVGTPAYVYSAASITGAFRGLDRALGRLPHTLCYSVKANSNLSILRLLAGLGSGFDIVSGGELYRLQRAGVAVNRVVFSGRRQIARGDSRSAARRDSPLQRGIGSGTGTARARGRAPRAARPGGDARESRRRGWRAPAHLHRAPAHKFGLDWPDARRLYLAHRDSQWIDWQGISAHIGSQILTLAPFRRALARLGRYVRELARAGVSLRYLDIGGGLGVRYWKEQPLAPAVYARAVAAMVRPLGCHLLLEPGRSIVAPAGVLLTRVLYTKRNRGKRFVIVDAAMNDFIRPALYDAVHPITPARLGPASAGRAGSARTSSVRFARRAIVSCGIGRSEKWPRAICWCFGALELMASPRRQTTIRGRVRPKCSSRGSASASSGNASRAAIWCAASSLATRPFEKHRFERPTSRPTSICRAVR